MDLQTLFNVTLPAQLAANPDKAKKIGAKFQINVTGDGGGSWFIDASPTGPNITQGTSPADVTFTIAEPDAQTLMQNPQANAMMLFFAGKLKVSGDQLLAMKLSSLFRLDV